MRATLLPALLLLAAATHAAADPAAPMSRLRGSSDAERALIRRVLDRSPTARALARELDASDVIVYVQLTPGELPGHAATRLVTATARHRFLRVVIGAFSLPSDVPSLFAHELQHVVEIARAPEARDNEGLQRLYRRIGEDRSARVAFETTEARTVSLQVRREMARGVSPAAAAEIAALEHVRTVFALESGPDAAVCPTGCQ